MSTSVNDDKFLEINLKYFEIHAAQRLTVFNYYVAISGTILAALGAVAQSSERYSMVGVLLGALLTIISFLFGKLDARTAFLVKHAEGIIKKIEMQSIPNHLQVFGLEDTETKKAQLNKNVFTKMYTYGSIFSFLFYIVGTIGMIGSLLLASRIAGLIDWSEDKEKSPEVTVVLQIPAASIGAVVNHPPLTTDNSGRVPALANDVRNVASEADPSGKLDPKIGTQPGQ